MAEQAAKEPTMEEILASIRQIISEDGDTEIDLGEVDAVQTNDLEATLDTSSENAFDVSELLDSKDDVSGDVGQADNENDDFLSVDELLGDDAANFSDLDDLNTLEAGGFADETLPEDITLEPQVELEMTDGNEAQSIEDILGEIQSVEAAALSAAEATPAAPVMETPMPEPKPAPVITAPVAPPPVAAAAPVASAASALGVAGAGNALEGLVTELMKPVIKEWIDTNLPAMVERRVEAEINQIAAKVISALRD